MTLVGDVGVESFALAWTKIDLLRKIYGRDCY
jgi:hypothetical protein